MPAHEYYHNWDLRNRDLAQTLEHYVVRGFAPGSFTTAVLANDLFGAVTRADHWNRPAIAEIVQEIVRTCPITAYGSYEAVAAWIDDQDGRRSRYVEYLEKERMMDILSGEENLESEKTEDFPF